MAQADSILTAVARPGNSARTRSRSGQRVRVAVVRPKVRQLRLIGMFFDHDKSFVLPSGMNGIRRVREVYDKRAFSHLLAVGHTDSVGKAAYNRSLSLERAQSVIAYLSDNVEAWFRNYQHATHGCRWGRREDELMLSALPANSDKPYLSEDGFFKDAVKEFQTDAGLVVDGICGPNTRRALIRDYMRIDGTSLPQDVEVVAHGCGEHFPAEDLGDNAASEENRRVELFAFDTEITPYPTKIVSLPMDAFYPAWLDRVEETVDLTEELPDGLQIRLCDDQGDPMPGTFFLARIGNEPAQDGRADSHGFISLTPPKICPEMLKLAWGADSEDGQYRYVRELFVECDGGVSEQQVLTKLHNLGYPSTDDFDIAVQAFQFDHNVDCDPKPAGLVNGDLPAATRERLNQEFEARQFN